MSILPENPTDGQIFTYGSKTWQWSTERISWLSVSTVTNLTGPTGAAGASESISNFVTVTNNYTMTTANDVVEGNSSSALIITLPDAATVKSYYFKNSGTGSMTLQPINSQQINGEANLVLQFVGSSCRLISTGSNFLIF